MDEFWKNNGDKVLVGVVTAIVILILSEPIKALFKKIGNWIEKAFQSLGFGFQKRYGCNSGIVRTNVRLIQPKEAL